MSCCFYESLGATNQCARSLGIWTIRSRPTRVPCREALPDVEHHQKTESPRPRVLGCRAFALHPMFRVCRWLPRAADRARDADVASRDVVAMHCDFGRECIPGPLLLPSTRVATCPPLGRSCQSPSLPWKLVTDHAISAAQPDDSRQCTAPGRRRMGVRGRGVSRLTLRTVRSCDRKTALASQPAGIGGFLLQPPDRIDEDSYCTAVSFDECPLR